jgi:hypothetical protein
MAINRLLQRLVLFIAVWIITGCSPVHVLRLTSETFPSTAVNDVAILTQPPSVAYQDIAELTASSSTHSVERLQRDILKKAAKLGAEAVIFSPLNVHREQRVGYEPMYSPYGYYAPYYYGPAYWGGFGFGGYGPRYYGGMYGPWGPGWGYGTGMAVPYTVRIQTLKGRAIRYLVS